MTSQIKLRGPVYSTQWWSMAGRKGKWMSGVVGVSAFEAGLSIDGICAQHKRARLLVTFAGPKADDDPTNALHTLVVKEFSKMGELVYENVGEFKKFEARQVETTPAAAEK